MLAGVDGLALGRAPYPFDGPRDDRQIKAAPGPRGRITYANHVGVVT